MGCGNNLTTGIVDQSVDPLDGTIHALYVYRNTLHTSGTVLTITNSIMTTWGV